MISVALPLGNRQYVRQRLSPTVSIRHNRGMGGKHQHVKSYVCVHVFDLQRPVLYVTRPDGDWCFLCGSDDHPDDASAYRVVGLGHAVERDPSLAEVMNLEPNEEAERDEVGSAWVRTAL